MMVFFVEAILFILFVICIIKKSYDFANVLLFLFIFFIIGSTINYFLGPQRCNDGYISHSIGKMGACSHHGGVQSRVWVFFVAFIITSIISIYFSNFSQKIPVFFKKLRNHLYANKKKYVYIFIITVTLGCSYKWVNNLNFLDFLSQHTNILRLCIYLGYDTEKTNTHNDSLMSFAIRRNNIKLVKFLLDNGADVNFVLSSGENALHLATMQKDIKLVKLLLDNGADVNFVLSSGENALHLAIVQEDIELVKLLLDNGANVNVSHKPRIGKGSLKNYYYQKNNNPFDNKNRRLSPIDIAICNKNFKIAKLLIDSGADVNLRDEDGEFPLWRAVCNEDITGVKFLIQNGANVNLKDNDGRTLLMLSVYLKNNNITKFLIFHGADITTTDQRGGTLLHFAIYNKAYYCKSYYDYLTNDYLNNIIELLIARGVDISAMLSAKDDLGNTLLHTAIQERLYDKAIILIQNGARVDIKNKEGKYPINLALAANICETNKRLIETLIKYGPINTINSYDTNGKTPLHFAVETNDLSLVRALLNKGADVNLKDKDGFSPLHYVQSIMIKQVIINNTQKNVAKKTWLPSVY